MSEIVNERAITVQAEEPAIQRARQGRGAYRTPEQVQAALERLNDFYPALPDDPQMDGVHKQRFGAWLHGFSQVEIADNEGVTENAVRRSVLVHLTRLPILDALLMRNIHTASRMHNDKGEKFFKAMDKVFAGEKGWASAAAAMKAYRLTTGLEGTGSVVQVNVDNRKQSVHMAAPAQAQTFEGMMDAVRVQLRTEEQAAPLQLESVIDAEILDARMDNPENVTL